MFLLWAEDNDAPKDLVDVAMGIRNAVLKIDDREMRNMSDYEYQQSPVTTTGQEAGTNKVAKPRRRSGVPQPANSSSIRKGNRTRGAKAPPLVNEPQEAMTGGVVVPENRTRVPFIMSTPAFKVFR